jgi:hypothetical protein
MELVVHPDAKRFNDRAVRHRYKKGGEQVANVEFRISRHLPCDLASVVERLERPR